MEVPQITYKSEDLESRAKLLYGSWYQESKYEVLNSIKPLCFRSSGGMIFIQISKSHIIVNLEAMIKQAFVPILFILWDNSSFQK